MSTLPLLQWILIIIISFINNNLASWEWISLSSQQYSKVWKKSNSFLRKFIRSKFSDSHSDMKCIRTYVCMYIRKLMGRYLLLSIPKHQVCQLNLSLQLHLFTFFTFFKSFYHGPRLSRILPYPIVFDSSFLFSYFLN